MKDGATMFSEDVLSRRRANSVFRSWQSCTRSGMARTTSAFAKSWSVPQRRGPTAIPELDSSMDCYSHGGEWARPGLRRGR